jgi:hypothetical protein
VPGVRRRIEQLEKTIVTREGDDTPRWLIMHLSYSDGSEVYEVHSLEGAPLYRRFAHRSELDAWLHKWRNTQLA